MWNAVMIIWCRCFTEHGDVKIGICSGVWMLNFKAQPVIFSVINFKGILQLIRRKNQNVSDVLKGFPKRLIHSVHQWNMHPVLAYKLFNVLKRMFWAFVRYFKNLIEYINTYSIHYFFSQVVKRYTCTSIGFTA